MKKQNVFLVAMRSRNAAGKLDGAIVERIICAKDEHSVRQFISETMPEWAPVSVVGLAQLEEQARAIREVLKGNDLRWPVSVDPAL